MSEDSRSHHAKAIDAGGATDMGKVRKHNEDSLLIRKDLRLFVVADGAGGHNAGNIASMLAVKSIENYFEATEPTVAGQPEKDRFGLMTQGRRLAAAVQKANADVMEISRASEERKGMGSTVVAAYLRTDWNRLYLAHVGDSRCYRLRAGHLEALTHDHTMRNDILEMRPDIDDAVLRRLPCGVVTRALGMGDKVRVELRAFDLAAGDRYLLCTDGLYREVPEDALSVALRSRDAPEAVARQLVAAGNRARGSDNLTALVIDCFRLDKHSRRDDASPVSVRDSAASAPEILLLGIENDSGMQVTGDVKIVPSGGYEAEVRRAVAEFVAPLRSDRPPASIDLSKSAPCGSCQEVIPAGARFCPYCGLIRRA
ncbi:MAG: protein phosphatase 2C domain-containing protein [Polyangiaceae bacterium]|nr:protein phosphatase 2C domain-containing protein [Polyangiaceae bacterium]